jgi:hypothetical protein
MSQRAQQARAARAERWFAREAAPANIVRPRTRQQQNAAHEEILVFALRFRASLSRFAFALRFRASLSRFAFALRFRASLSPLLGHSGPARGDQTTPKMVPRADTTASAREAAERQPNPSPRRLNVSAPDSPVQPKRRCDESAHAFLARITGDRGDVWRSAGRPSVSSGQTLPWRCLLARRALRRACHCDGLLAGLWQMGLVAEQSVQANGSSMPRLHGSSAGSVLASTATRHW